MMDEPLSKADRRRLERRWRGIKLPLAPAGERRLRGLLDEDIPELLEAYDDAVLRGDMVRSLNALQQSIHDQQVAKLSARIDELAAEARGEGRGERCGAVDVIAEWESCYPELNVTELCGREKGHDGWHECNRCGIGFLLEGEPGFDEVEDEEEADGGADQS